VSPVFQMRKLRAAWQAGLLSETQMHRRIRAIANLRPGMMTLEEKLIRIHRYVTS